MNCVPEPSQEALEGERQAVDEAARKEDEEDAVALLQLKQKQDQERAFIQQYLKQRQETQLHQALDEAAEDARSALGNAQKLCKWAQILKNAGVCCFF